jgi:predicted pyridoxine 5'-phosphate oxidase superfamily flavin-nucleotide-binding protein
MRELQCRPVRGGAPDRTLADDLPPTGSHGEHILQQRYGTADRAGQFYRNQVTDQLTPEMIEFVGRMEMAFIATSDAAGDCDCSFRAGTAGFVRVLDERTIAYPEFRGNGVMASLGNILENPRVGILMIDFTHSLIGLHVNGAAEIVTPEYMLELDEPLPEQAANAGRRPVQWVLVRVTEAYIHCSKHIPKLVPESRVRHWGTDNPRHKGGDFFGVAARNLAGPAEAQVPVGAGPTSAGATSDGPTSAGPTSAGPTSDGSEASAGDQAAGAGQPGAARRDPAGLHAGAPVGPFML